MKKNSHRQIKDYSKYDSTEYEYYGLLEKQGVLRIDPKRLKKTTRMDKHIFVEMNKPRKTVYFIPNKKHRSEYMCNIFRDTIENLEVFWENEFIHALRAIKTPSKVKQDTFSGHFAMSGILEHDEVGIHANMQALKRSHQYGFVIQSMIAQFIHQIASTIEATTIQVISKQGYQQQDFNRNSFNSFVQGKKSIKLEDIVGFEAYDKFYNIWHFLKHNTKDLHNKIQNKYPEVLNDYEYEHGDLALYALKIDKSYITKVLNDIRVFFENLCEIVFDEDIKNAHWNYEDYFRSYIYCEIELIAKSN